MNNQRSTSNTIQLYTVCTADKLISPTEIIRGTASWTEPHFAKRKLSQVKTRVQKQEAQDIKWHKLTDKSRVIYYAYVRRDDGSTVTIRVDKFQI